MPCIYSWKPTERLVVELVDDWHSTPISPVTIRLHHEYVKTCESGKAWKKKRKAFQGVGRSDSSVVIDNILQSHHRNWDSLDDTGKSALRARFHECKRYGKGWSLLADSLGRSSILLCSQKLANLIHNTTMTLKTLNFMIDDIQFRQPDIMGILEVVEQLADDLVHNGRVLCDVSSVLTKLRDIRHSIAPSHRDFF
ncbi:hypothetical protein BDV27DRAFT_146965 [Aspergillus caelatus]|uniref:Uncharacterized protein n=1 Tax=Aspergillus caelatus TaxID=61420 RepID=A0A5N6ZYH1_9EURO|nr:uncharacterized protein BDV27DRAFT_146965 [Aspergillus caelatus]KAE8362465.1 hypothetical protein BDV27DRAFT_146965 [Aspergillus caelatus]